jgi:serine/threonine-protein kinase
VRRLPGTDGASDLFLSPDGQEIGFVAKRRLYRLALRGEQPAEIATLPNGFIGGGTWTNDGRMVIAVNSVLYVVSAAGGELKPLITADINRFQATSPFYVAEANAILFTRASLDSQPIVEWLTLSTGKSRRVVAGATPTYVASRKALLLVRPDGTLVSYPFNAASGDTTGPPVRLAEDIALQSPVFAYGEYAAAQNGTVVLAVRREATSGPGAAVTMWAAGAANVSTTLKIPVDASHFDSPRISPDGTRLAIAAQDRATRRHSIYVYDFRRGTSIRLTSDQESDQLAWNGAGDSIVYRVGPKSFMSRPADGSGESKEVVNLHDWVSVGGHSVRGSWIAFCGEKTNSFRIADIAVSHRDSSGRVEAYAATNFAEFEPAISPDGQWLVYSSVETGRPEVYVSTFPVPGARIPVSRNGGHGAVWSRDGHTIFYANLGRDFYAVKFNPGNPPTLGDERTIFNASSVSPWTIDPDGRRLITTGVIDRGDVTGLILLIDALSTSR